jgi:hypothetical protein
MKRADLSPTWDANNNGGFGGKPNPSEPEQSNEPEKPETSTEEKKDEPNGK